MPKSLFGSSAFAANAAALLGIRPTTLRNCPAGLQTCVKTNYPLNYALTTPLLPCLLKNYCEPLDMSVVNKSKRFYEHFTVPLCKHVPAL